MKDEENGASLCSGNAGGAGAAQPGEGKTERGPHPCLSLPAGRAQGRLCSVEHSNGTRDAQEFHLDRRKNFFPGW